jgi:ATP/maltotriose-dependent transcriptional regulator MalT
LIAHHYAAAGDQPAALRATVGAAQAASKVHAYCEVADLADRALELWPRVPDAAELAGLDRVELLSLAAEAQSLGGHGARGEMLLQAALKELDPLEDRRRYSGLLARLARVQWNLNRGEEGVQTAKQALSMLPESDGGHERAFLLTWLARIRFLRGRFRDAVSDGEDALAAAVASADLRAEGEVLNTLGMAEIALGSVDQGSRGCVARVRSRSTSTISAGSQTPTPTWPTC